ncbi:hypothetical protein [Halorussus amylolyticus]|uniref:hypothetical protein n=1 Tax=Halorussus amylolyticus TaxID=1126242 RepID=UPI00104EB231|nr:hypothetical protein [Halorussus amylolyticus]
MVTDDADEMVTENAAETKSDEIDRLFGSRPHIRVSRLTEGDRPGDPSADRVAERPSRTPDDGTEPKGTRD